MTSVVVSEAARSVAGRALPPVPRLERDSNGNFPVSLVLFYQYVEPAWNELEHRAALNFVIKLAQKHKINGRGRCAPEGLNCTLSGSAADIRAFCLGLRSWDKTFEQTDFKISDGIYYGKRFKALTIRKVNELVAYGLSGEKAPSLNYSNAKHLEADEYHKLMEAKDTVIIDVRNAYESAIGHFQPPEGGAELLDPKMRNSHEFPKWLNMDETKEKLKGKKVMMYCTGGIRCERASALLHQMETVSIDLHTQGIYMVRGGIERYLKTYPEGGYWKGFNYLFDRRLEQQPELKSAEALEKDVESVCCLCGKPWNKYRGQFKCPEPLCKVPVLVCFECADAGETQRKATYCPLCVEGHELRTCALPDFVSQKQKLFGRDVCAPAASAASAANGSGGGPGGRGGVVSTAIRTRKVKGEENPSERLFVGNLPLLVSASAVREALLKAQGPQGEAARQLQWLFDRTTGAFYGSIFVKMGSVKAARLVVEAAASKAGIRLAGSGGCKRPRRLRVHFAPYQGSWPPEGHMEHELPPLNITSDARVATEDLENNAVRGDEAHEHEAGAEKECAGSRVGGGGGFAVKSVGSLGRFQKMLRRCGSKVTVVKFGAQWCATSQNIAPLIHTHTHTRTLTYIHTYTYIDVCMYVYYIYIYLYVCVCVCVYIYIYILHIYYIGAGLVHKSGRYSPPSLPPSLRY
jgi:predicted sulfurtransferase